MSFRLLYDPDTEDVVVSDVVAVSVVSAVSVAAAVEAAVPVFEVVELVVERAGPKGLGERAGRRHQHQRRRPHQRPGKTKHASRVTQ